MSFIRRHWFSLLTGLFVFIFFILFVLVLLSPRQDARKRGFIPCTEVMAEKLLNCEGSRIFCLLSAVVDNSWCDMKVVGRGFYAWVAGKQPAPWSNYIFVPELPADQDFDAAARAEYLKANPDIKTEMRQLQKLNEELENEENREQQVAPDQQPQ